MVNYNPKASSFPQSMLRVGDGLGWNKFGGPYRIPAKCFHCNPEPCSLDRVFVITSTGDKHVAKPAQ